MENATKSIPAIIQEFLDSSHLPDESTVRHLVKSEPELATILILEQARRLRDLQAPKPSTPSGMVPVYEKPSTKGRKRKPGREKGHPGSRRPVPQR